MVLILFCRNHWHVSCCSSLSYPFSVFYLFSSPCAFKIVFFPCLSILFVVSLCLLLMFPALAFFCNPACVPRALSGLVVLFFSIVFWICPGLFLAVWLLAYNFLGPQLLVSKARFLFFYLSACGSGFLIATTQHASHAKIYRCSHTSTATMQYTV